jgi:hypothetical protein
LKELEEELIMRNVLLGAATLGLLAAACALTVGCSSNSCSDNGSCGQYVGPDGGGAGGASGAGGSSASGGTSGTDGGAGTSGSGGMDGGEAEAPSCDTSGDPTSESCLVADQYAVFVDGTAATDGNGTKASPFKTIAEGVAAANGRLVLVCDTTYDEQVKLTAGVKLYGGFNCTDWSRDAGKRAVVAPTAKGTALDVESVGDPVLIEGMEFDAQDGTAAGESSIAAFVNGSSNVSFLGVKLIAGQGAAGASGVLTKFTYPTGTQLDGNDAVTIAGGALKQCACPAGDQSIGGRGGDAPTPQDGNPGLPALGGGAGGKAGQSCAGNPSGSGSDGNPATAPSDASGASTLGALSSTGWTPSKGANGAPGGPGQGGGGGASTATGGGGGGGCGGCGGAAGPGGGGGGASVALIVLNSTVTVDATSELVTGNAGDGGSGAAGQTGDTTFGLGGNRDTGGCAGGNGGAGADGGAGGGGAGGVSVAVLWKGTAAPTVDPNATITLGAKGSAGTGGDAGHNDGVDGTSQSVVQVN